ncbi:flippase-like domain-containing protein [Candidatus Bipolaricaulota bacterium]|nr:flippase-like domain-containing protein [Candidatus Bipolaricaulota bacterium]
MRLGRKATTALSVVLGVAILAAILWYIGPAKVWSQISSLGWDGFALMVGAIVLTFFFWTLAWIVVMKGYGVVAPFSLSFWARIGSFSVSFLTPSMHFGGEPVRALVIERETDSTYSRAFATIVAERITMLAALVTVILIGAMMGVYTRLSTNTLPYLVLISLIFFGLVVTLILNFFRKLFLFTRFAAFLKRHLPWTRLLQKAEDSIRHLEKEIGMAFGQHKKHTGVAFLLDLAATVFMFIRPQIYFYYTQGRLFSIVELTMLFAMISVLSSLFWVTPGGIGVSEGGFIGIFAIFGISGSEAVAYSFSLKAIQLFFVGFGLVLLAHYGIMRLLFEGKKEE